MARLKDKVAIVTGGGRGIGLAITQAMAEAGASVVIASRKLEPLQAAAASINEAVGDERVHATACHIGKSEQVAQLLEFTSERLGVPDILINNSATNPYFGPMLGVEERAWDKTFEVNLKGTFELTRGVVQAMMGAGKGGSVVTISSILGTTAAPLQGVYGMTKAALISMTQTLAVELGPTGIRFNAIAPGLIDTRFAAAITGSDDLRAMYESRTALERVGAPHEVAGMVVFLASDESSYVSGQVMRVDGGFGLR